MYGWSPDNYVNFDFSVKYVLKLFSINPQQIWIHCLPLV